MDLPSAELSAPSPVLLDVSGLDASTRVVSAMGGAKGLERLAAIPGLERLWISGVTAKVAGVVARLASLRDLTVHDLRVPDLRLVAGLGGLRSLVVAGSTRLRSLDGIEALERLRTLILFDVGVEDLAPLRGLRDLEALSIEGGMSRDLRVPTLDPLAGLAGLVRLRIASLRVADGGLRPLHGLLGVRHVFIPDMFPPAEMRALAAALPEARGEWLDSYRRDPAGQAELRRRAARRKKAPRA